MDWNSEEGKALLWKAWPDGYLAMRGVTALNGAVCVRVFKCRMSRGVELHPCFYLPGPDAIPGKGRPSRSAVLTPDGAQGYGASAVWWDEQWDDNWLLPHPDPADHATWACLLADLAKADGLHALDVIGDGSVVVGHFLTINVDLDNVATCTLTAVTQDGIRHSSFWRVATEDPAEALVRVRIRVREEHGR